MVYFLFENFFIIHDIDIAGVAGGKMVAKKGI